MVSAEGSGWEDPEEPWIKALNDTLRAMGAQPVCIIKIRVFRRYTMDTILQTMHTPLHTSTPRSLTSHKSAQNHQHNTSTPHILPPSQTPPLPLRRLRLRLIRKPNILPLPRRQLTVLILILGIRVRVLRTHTQSTLSSSSLGGSLAQLVGLAEVAVVLGSGRHALGAVVFGVGSC